MQILKHSTESHRALLDQLAAPKVRKGLRTFDAHLWRRASLNARRNSRNSAGSAASSTRAFDMRSSTCPGAQGAQALAHLVAHLARLRILRRFPKTSRDEKFRFSTTLTAGEEKCRDGMCAFLRTFEPFRELSTDLFAATSPRAFVSPQI
jgi:hypothetical protein